MNRTKPVPRRFGKRSTAEDVTAGLDLSGKTIAITGVATGIGLESMRVLAKRGAHVIGLARSLDKAARACRSVEGRTTPLACDLSEPGSVKACADAILAMQKPIDALIANAGIMALPRLEKKHGLELQFLTNHLGHFILVTRLLEAVKAARGRIVIVSSAAHSMAPRDVGLPFDNLSGEKSYSAWPFYGQSKLANALFARELAQRVADSGVTVNALHPGVITSTGLLRYSPVKLVGKLLGPLFGKTIAQGAATQCYIAVHRDAEGISGKYWSDCRPVAPTRHALDDGQAQHLWEVSERMVTALAA